MSEPRQFHAYRRTRPFYREVAVIVPFRLGRSDSWAVIDGVLRASWSLACPVRQYGDVTVKAMLPMEREYCFTVRYSRPLGHSEITRREVNVAHALLVERIENAVQRYAAHAA
jgi:hypothetical protein